MSVHFPEVMLFPGKNIPRHTPRRSLVPVPRQDFCFPRIPLPILLPLTFPPFLPDFDPLLSRFPPVSLLP